MKKLHSCQGDYLRHDKTKDIISQGHFRQGTFLDQGHFNKKTSFQFKKITNQWTFSSKGTFHLNGHFQKGYYQSNRKRIAAICGKSMKRKC